MCARVKTLFLWFMVIHPAMDFLQWANENKHLNLRLPKEWSIKCAVYNALKKGNGVSSFFPLMAITWVSPHVSNICIKECIHPLSDKTAAWRTRRGRSRIGAELPGSDEGMRWWLTTGCWVPNFWANPFRSRGDSPWQFFVPKKCPRRSSSSLPNDQIYRSKFNAKGIEDLVQLSVY